MIGVVSPFFRERPRQKQHFSHFCTGNWGSKSDKGDGIDGILKEDEAAQVASNITNDSSAKTNERNWDAEAGVTVGNS